MTGYELETMETPFETMLSLIEAHPLLTLIVIIIVPILLLFVSVAASIAHELKRTIIEYASNNFFKQWKESERQKQEEDSQKLKNDITMEKDVIKDGKVVETQKELDALGLMQHNLEDIKTYYTWSQQQAKDSFSFARIMSVAGFLMIVVSVVLISIFGKSLEVAIISAVGGVITELLAATVMIVYRNSMEQLNHYHKALHEDERFLSSINLIEKFKNAKMRDNMLKRIIESEIEMNLAGIDVKKPANDEGQEAESSENASEQQPKEVEDGV